MTWTFLLLMSRGMGLRISIKSSVRKISLESEVLSSYFMCIGKDTLGNAAEASLEFGQSYLIVYEFQIAQQWSSRVRVETW